MPEALCLAKLEVSPWQSSCFHAGHGEGRSRIGSEAGKPSDESTTAPGDSRRYVRVGRCAVTSEEIEYEQNYREALPNFWHAAKRDELRRRLGSYR